MPGQRYASLKIRIPSIADLNPAISIWLNGAYENFVADWPIGSIGSEAHALSLAAAIRARLSSAGKAHTYTVAVLPGPNPPESIILLTATGYETAQNFQPSISSSDGELTGLREVERIDGIKPVLVTYTTTIVRCFGSSTGGITLSASNGTSEPTGPYIYVWDDGSTYFVPTRTNLPQGDYTVTVNDTTGAYQVVTITLGQNPALVVTINRVGNDLSTVVSGGVAPYTYQWADGPTTPGRAGASGGVTYTVLVTDSLGCTKQASLRFELLRYWFSGNAIPLVLDAGDDYRADPTTKPDLRFACEVYIEPDYLSNVFERVGQVLEQPADPDGRTTFEVQELLEPFVAYHLPAPNQAFVSAATGLFRRFYLRHYEITTDGPGVAVTLDDNYLVRGGLGFVEAATGTWFGGYQETNMPFLTWEPTTKSVLADQPEYLYFMVPRFTMDAFQYCLLLTFADGSTQTVVHTTQADVLRYEVYCLPAGYGQLGLAAYEQDGRTLVQWQAYVLDGTGAPASERRTYTLNRRHVGRRRYFHYTNSLGGVNTLTSRGPGHQRQLATTTLSGSTVAAAGYEAVQGDVRIDRRTGQPTLKCYAGARLPEQLRADEDFMLSERVLLLEENTYLAGTVKDRTFSVDDEDETRRVLEFDFELPRERYFTPRLRP
jgi:hypothetical protein